tara:strand:+ start:944 stop:1462 length:519 start_codon:yes stop_codon:yes gene_type:complete
MSVIISGSTGITLPDSGTLSTSINGAMVVSSTGAVTTPYQPSFYAYPNANTTGANTTYIKVGFQAAFHNTGNHYNTSTSLFTAPVAGSYQFNTNCRFDGFAGGYHLLRLYNNTSAITGAYAISTDNGAYNTLNLNAVVDLQVNDAVSVYVYGNGDSSWNINGHSSFSGYLLG